MTSGKATINMKGRGSSFSLFCLLTFLKRVKGKKKKIGRQKDADGDTECTH